MSHQKIDKNRLNVQQKIINIFNILTDKKNLNHQYTLLNNLLPTILLLNFHHNNYHKTKKSKIIQIIIYEVFSFNHSFIEPSSFHSFEEINSPSLQIPLYSFYPPLYHRVSNPSHFPSLLDYNDNSHYKPLLANKIMKTIYYKN